MSRIIWSEPGRIRHASGRSGSNERPLELARRVNPFALPEEAELGASVARRKVRVSGHKADSLALQRKKRAYGY